MSGGNEQDQGKQSSRSGHDRSDFAHHGEPRRQTGGICAWNRSFHLSAKRDTQSARNLVRPTFPAGLPNIEIVRAKIVAMQVTVNVPDQLAAQARARGVAVEAYVEEVPVRQALEPEAEAHRKSVGEAIDRIMELRKGNTLGGVKVKDLIYEGRKF